nr:PREDICTED: uncharacterized protein C5orf47 homolog [Equus przewalskii]
MRPGALCSFGAADLAMSLRGAGLSKNGGRLSVCSVYVCVFLECLTQKNLAKKFDFPIPLNEASKILKKKKKVLAWNRVYKVISRMLEENEKYRLRLKRQQLSSENSDHTG